MTTASLKVPFGEYSSFTLAIVPVFVQVMFRFSPTVQASPPTGAVSAREPLIVKLALESSKTVASPVSVTRTRTAVPIASGTVHA